MQRTNNKECINYADAVNDVSNVGITWEMLEKEMIMERFGEVTCKGLGANSPFEIGREQNLLQISKQVGGYFGRKQLF